MNVIFRKIDFVIQKSSAVLLVIHLLFIQIKLSLILKIIKKRFFKLIIKFSIKLFLKLIIKYSIKLSLMLIFFFLNSGLKLEDITLQE
jgi:hypothetical protein